MAMGYPDKVLRPDSLNLTLDQNKHLAPDIGANQAGLLSSLRDLLQNIAASMGRSSGWSITKGVSVGVCIHIHIHHIHARTYIYIYHHSSTSFIPLLFHTLASSDNCYNSKRLDLPPGESWSHRPRDGHGASLAKGMLMIINGIFIY